MERVSDIVVELDVAPPQARTAHPSRAVDFYELTKPRMNFLVLITTMVGFFVASRGLRTEWVLLANTLLGTAMCAASASVLNQIIERDYDALMPRTRNRPLPQRRVSTTEALTYGVLLGVAGIGYLLLTVNLLTALLGAITLASYVWIYTPMKRHSSLNTVV